MGHRQESRRGPVVQGGNLTCSDRRALPPVTKPSKMALFPLGPAARSARCIHLAGIGSRAATPPHHGCGLPLRRSWADQILASVPMGQIAPSALLSVQLRRAAAPRPTEGNGSLIQCLRAGALLCCRKHRTDQLTETNSMSKIRSLPANGWLASSVTVASSTSTTVTGRTCPSGVCICS